MEIEKVVPTHIKLISIGSGLTGLLLSYMSFTMPQEIKDGFNATDGFWIAWGWVFLVTGVVWLIGATSLFDRRIKQ